MLDVMSPAIGKPFAVCQCSVSVCQAARLIAGNICTSVIENPMSNDSHVTSFVKYSWFLWITFRQPRTLTNSHWT